MHKKNSGCVGDVDDTIKHIKSFRLRRIAEVAADERQCMISMYGAAHIYRQRRGKKVLFEIVYQYFPCPCKPQIVLKTSLTINLCACFNILSIRSMHNAHPN